MMEKPTPMVNAPILASTTRNGYIENRHWGWLAIGDASAHCYYSTPGADEVAIFLRSSAKPLQALPLVLSGIHHKLSPEELALCCASHPGSAYHTELVTSILQKAGLGAQALQCGPHAPIDFQTAQDLSCNRQNPKPIHNNCSGKHAGMLLCCIANGWDTTTYLDPYHPLQQEIANIIKNYAGLDEPVCIGRDGCGTPTYYLPILNAAALYARLGTEPNAKPIVEAMTTHPQAAGGTGRIDTAIMQASGGQLLAKVGAEGMIAVSCIEKDRALVLKIADGNESIRNHLIPHLLHAIGWLNSEALSNAVLAPFVDRELRNTQNIAIGEIVPHLPEQLPLCF